jgi:hypothetical protein
MAQSAERFASLLEDLHSTVTPALAARAQHLRGLRQSAGRACVTQLECEAGSKLAQAVLHLAGAAEVPDAMIETLEASMAALRALADAARRLDHAAAAETALRPAITTLVAQLPYLPHSGPALLRADALRLLEILEGADRASRA